MNKEKAIVKRTMEPPITHINIMRLPQKEQPFWKSRCSFISSGVRSPLSNLACSLISSFVGGSNHFGSGMNRTIPVIIEEGLSIGDED